MLFSRIDASEKYKLDKNYNSRGRSLGQQELSYIRDTTVAVDVLMEPLNPFIIQHAPCGGRMLLSQVKDKIVKRYYNIQQLGRISDSVKKIEGLDLRDILMTDATIITGVLILVSISASNPNPVVGVITPIGLFIVALMIVLLFSISAYSALEGNLKNAKRFAQWGFIALMMSFGITLFAALMFQIQHPPAPAP